MKRASIHTAEHAALVGLLKDLRLEAGLSQAAVAAQLERPQTYVSAVEVGERGLDVFQVRELAALYGTSFPDFATALEARIAGKPYRPPRLERSTQKPLEKGG